MRRRLSAPLLAMVVAALCLLPTAAIAVPSSSPVVLAAETGEGEGPPGPEPASADDTENPAAPENYEANFLWGAAVGLLALMLLGALALAGLYWLQVVRPRKQADATRQ